MQPLYASVLQLNRKDCQALKVTDVYSLHRVVYSLFDDIRSLQQKNGNTQSGIQWVDKGGGAYGRQVLMLSDREPASCVSGEFGEVRCKRLPEQFLSHQCYRFEVVINPVRRSSQSKKLIPVKGRSDIAAWFTERAQTSWGFRVHERQLDVRDVRVEQFDAKYPVTLQQATISGSLEVIESLVFQKHVASGIGKARSFGCGLLQVVPVPENPFL